MGFFRAWAEGWEETPEAEAVDDKYRNRRDEAVHGLRGGYDGSETANSLTFQNGFGTERYSMAISINRGS